MRGVFVAFCGFLALALSSGAGAADPFVAGTHYAVLQNPAHTTVPAGKVEVLEVFSYGCPACNRFQPIVEQLKAHLPPQAQMAFLPAAFIPQEDWPMFQRAYITAQFLKVAEKTHQGIYDAIWKTGELATFEPGTNRLKNPLPTIEDAARVYQKLAGVKPQEFIATAKSFSVDAKMKAADAQIEQMQVSGTPTLVVAGKYKVILDSISSLEQLAAVVNFLVAKEVPAAAAKP